MNLIPWRAKRKTGEFSALNDLRREVDRLFDSFLSLRPDPLDIFGGTRAPAPWLPTIDVAETTDQFNLYAEIPGVDPKDIEITVVGNRLTIAGEKQESHEQCGHDVHVSERRYGSFRRSIDLASAVDPNQIDAQCVHGVLTVKLKKVKPAQARRIAVTPG